MKGFTLIEILVVAAITVMLTGFLIQSFSRARTDLNQVTGQVADAIREAQSSALSGALVQGKYRCGYGIHFDAGGYTIFAGPDATQSRATCVAAGRVFPGTGTSVVRTALLTNNVLEIAPSGTDIFFEPPNPTTYINISGGPVPSVTILVRVKGATCSVTPADCRSINVTTSGLIQQ